MEFLIRSLASPLVYWINCVNLSLESSIFFLNDSLNVDMKYIYSRGFLSNGSKSTCGADCPSTNFLCCSPATGYFCALLSSQLPLSMLKFTLRTGRMTDSFTPTRIQLSHISPLISIWYNCQIRWLWFLVGLEHSLPLLILHFHWFCFIKVFCNGYSLVCVSIIWFWGFWFFALTNLAFIFINFPLLPEP